MVGTLLQLASKLLGQHANKYLSEAFAPLAIQVLGIDYLSSQQLATDFIGEISSSLPSHSAWVRVVPPPAPLTFPTMNVSASSTMYLECTPSPFAAGELD